MWLVCNDLVVAAIRVVPIAVIAAISVLFVALRMVLFAILWLTAQLLLCLGLLFK